MLHRRLLMPGQRSWKFSNGPFTLSVSCLHCTLVIDAREYVFIKDWRLEDLPIRGCFETRNSLPRNMKCHTVPLGTIWHFMFRAREPRCPLSQQVACNVSGSGNYPEQDAFGEMLNEPHRQQHAGQPLTASGYKLILDGIQADQDALRLFFNLNRCLPACLKS